MLVVESYPLAVALCVVTMLCWGSWANTQKLASQQWPFQLFYWDYSIGVLLLTLVFAFTIGSTGEEGRSFLPDIFQAGGDRHRWTSVKSPQKWSSPSRQSTI
jgi:glucose uptake protein